jgi:pimeloyl-ACP methyl ester carboxylesterase
MTAYRSICILLLVACGAAATHAQQPPASAAGHWEGAITLPGTSLDVRVDLEEAAGRWAGTIEIPAQGLRGLALGGVAVEGSAVTFAMPGIPGAPTFTGTVAADRTTITGTFTQGGQAFPFRLARTARTGGETPEGVAGKGFAGHWQGALKPSPVMELRLVLEIADAASGSPTGIMISVDQGGVRVPLTMLTDDNGAVRVEASGIRAVFEGVMNANGSEISGQWRQGGNALPLAFRRLASAPTFSRPQDPTRPFPYEEEEVTFANPQANITLAGTFTRPRGAGPHPAVVLIGGSGPQDRDEALMGHRPFLVLADHLTRQGIAVLRYDDRGVGRSTGSFRAATHDDFVADTLAAVNWLKTRSDIDPARIGLVGHSEGGLAAPLAAVKQPGDIAFLVLLAGPGVPMEDLLVRQSQDLARIMGVDRDFLEQNSASQRAMFALLKEDTDSATLEDPLRALVQQQVVALTDEERKALGYTDAMMESQIQMVLTPWFRQLLAYDPRPVLRQVKVPVLALNGEKDLQVAARPNLAGMQEALTAGGNTEVSTRELPGLNHLFQTATTGSVAEYGVIEETFNPAALEAISEWIRRRTGLE